jgi:hypothetical protein
MNVCVHMNVHDIYLFMYCSKVSLLRTRVYGTCLLYLINLFYIFYILY